MKKWIIIPLLVLVCSGLKAQTLDDYLAEATKNNPGLKAKYAEFEAAMQRSAQVAQMPNPTLSFGYFIQPVETRVGPQQARIGLSQMFPWFGTLKSRSDAAAFIAEAKYYAFVDAREQLNISVKETYYQLFENHRLVQIEEENLRILETMKELSLNTYENGQGSLADVYRVEVMLDESQTQLRILVEQAEVWMVEFNNLLNRTLGEGIHGSDSLALPVLPEIGPMPEFSGHPLQRAVAEMQNASAASEQAAKRAGYPSIGLGVDYVFVGQRNDMVVPDNGKDAIMPMVSVSLPIYRKSYKAARTEAQKMQEAYAAQSLEIENTLETQWENARFALLEARQTVALLDRQITKTESIIALLLSSYSSGETDFEELLREQKKLLGFQRELAKTLVRFHTAQARMTYLHNRTQSLINE